MGGGKGLKHKGLRVKVEEMLEKKKRERDHLAHTGRKSGQ
jgi:hypothetical protein